MTEQATQVFSMPVIEVRHTLCGAVFYNGPLVTAEDVGVLTQRLQAHKILCPKRDLIPEIPKGGATQ